MEPENDIEDFRGSEHAPATSSMGVNMNHLYVKVDVIDLLPPWKWTLIAYFVEGIEFDPSMYLHRSDFVASTIPRPNPNPSHVTT